MIFIEINTTLFDNATGLFAGNYIKTATATDYDQSLFTETNSFVVYTSSDSGDYAFDGNAVPIFII